jgi:hypothetical protein
LAVRVKVEFTFTVAESVWLDVETVEVQTLTEAAEKSRVFGESVKVA